MRLSLASTVIVLALNTGCVSGLIGLGVVGAVEDARGWEEIRCGWQRNSPYPGHEVCARVELAAAAFGIEASPIWIDWVPSDCPPRKNERACIVDPWGRTVADYQQGSTTVVMAIHPDPFAPICKTAAAHGPAHIFLVRAGLDEDRQHTRPEWALLNGCNGG